MADNFNYSTKTGRIQVDDSQNVPFTPLPSLQNNTYLYGNRRNLITINFTGDTTSASTTITNVTNVNLLKVGYSVVGSGIPANSIISSIIGNQITLNNAATATAAGVALVANEISLPIPNPQAGYPRFNYYQVYQLEPELITNPPELLAYFSNCGYQVNYGYSGTTALNNIGAFSPNPAVPGQCTLYFENQSLNIANIANQALTGTFTISNTAITGTVVSVKTGMFNPQVTINFTGDTTSASTTITNLNIDANLLMLGSSITGPGIPVGATVSSIVSSSSITISLAATATAAGVALSYLSLEPLVADTEVILNSTDYTGLQVGENLTLNFIKQSSEPDINRTEPFIMNLWQSAMIVQDMNADNSNATVGAPGIYFSILPNASDTNFYGPTGNAMALGVAPSSVTGSGNLITIAIPKTANYASFIPMISLGATNITQATTNATGIVFQSIINGAMLEIQLQNVSGTFNTTDLLTLTLDNTVTIMNLQKAYFTNKKLSLRTFPCIYEINNNSDITTTHSALFEYVISLNDPVTANNGQGNCSIIFGNQTIPANLAVSQLPNDINNEYYEPVYIPFVLRAGVVNRTIAQSMCAMATMFASNEYPFNPLNDIVANGFDNSPYPQDWIDMSVGGDADQLINLGWNVIATNTENQQYLFLGRSGQTTINNIPDNEFYPTYILDTKDYIRRAIILICRNNGVGQVRQTDSTINKIDMDIVNLNTEMGNDGILSNVPNNNKLIRVIRSPNNPLGISIYDPIQQTPAFMYAYADVVNYSIQFTLN